MNANQNNYKGQSAMMKTLAKKALRMLAEMNVDPRTQCDEDLLRFQQIGPKTIQAIRTMTSEGELLCPHCGLAVGKGKPAPSSDQFPWSRLYAAERKASIVDKIVDALSSSNSVRETPNKEP